MGVAWQAHGRGGEETKGRGLAVKNGPVFPRHRRRYTYPQWRRHPPGLGLWPQGARLLARDLRCHAMVLLCCANLRLPSECEPLRQSHPCTGKGGCQALFLVASFHLVHVLLSAC